MNGSPIVNEIVWRPQRGPQAHLINCPFPEILFGGARGGGKTDGILGKYIIKGDRYGEDFNAIFFRREMPQTDDLVERAKEIYLAVGSTWREQAKEFRLPRGGRIRFRPLENTQDAQKYQGQNLCVSLGTRIVMADGTLRKIEEIQPGELVTTLEGPRRVLARTEPYIAPCAVVRVSSSSGEWIGAQIHPVWHPVLTIFGISPGCVEAEALDRSGFSSIAEQISSRKFPRHRTAWQPRAGVFSHTAASREPRRNAGRVFSAWFAWSEDGGNGCTTSSDEASEGPRPGGLCVPVVLHAPTARSARKQWLHCHGVSTLSRARGKFLRLSMDSCQVSQRISSGLRRLAEWSQSTLDHIAAFFHARPCDLLWTRTAQGFQFDCPIGPRFYDGPLRAYEEIGLDGIPSRGDAVDRLQSERLDASGTTQKRSPTSEQWWVHPYSGEERRLVEAVTCGRMECHPIGDAWVTDLCVEGANHYISETGLVNKNTDAAVEEAGNYPDPRPIDMLFGALRSKAGVPVQLILSANPGGPGQGWIKNRYIDPAPLGMTPLIRKLPNGTASHRYIYIPSRVQDNRKLLEADPGYIARLNLVGSPELVRAWLEGDWSVTEGAFFPEFSVDRHVIEPRELPSYWKRFRSMDWGSARPFAVHWWSVSDGELPSIPRGALVCYREWYGSSKPNTGLRMTAEEVAAGIKDREGHDIRGTTIMGGVADPAIFSSDGGPSIADRMAAHGVRWNPADNARIGRHGALGGWDQVRSRLKGDGERPAIFWFKTCVDAIRTIPMAQHDEIRAEDMDTEGEDHALDSIRYACMSRPYTAPLPESIDPPEQDRYARKRKQRQRGSAWAA